MDWTTVNAASLSLWYKKLLYHDEEELVQEEVLAKQTLRTVCALLDLKDPPSVAGYYCKTISEYHMLWLSKLPGFERIGHCEIATDFVSGRTFWRLWLLSDWNSERTQKQRREEMYKQRSIEWYNERCRYWRVYKRLVLDLGVTEQRARETLNNAVPLLRQKVMVPMELLNGLGFNKPEDVLEEERIRFMNEFKPSLRHAYVNTHDFASDMTLQQMLSIDNNENDSFKGPPSKD